MGRPSGTNNTMRTSEEKEKLVLEYLHGKEGYRRIAENNDIYPSVFLKWIHQYREKGIEGLKSKTGKHNNPKRGRYNRNKSEIEKLKEQLSVVQTKSKEAERVLNQEQKILQEEKEELLKGIQVRMQLVDILKRDIARIAYIESTRIAETEYNKLPPLQK